MYRRFINFLCIGGLVLSCGCSTSPAGNTGSTGSETNPSSETAQPENKGEMADLSMYQFVSEDSHIKSVGIDDVISAFDNKETAMLIIGYPDCYWCNRAMPVYNSLAGKNNDVIFYYLNISGDDVTLDKYNLLLEKVDKILMEDGDGEKALYVPQVLGIKDGEVTKNHLSLVDSYNEETQETMTEEQVAELEEIYTDILNSTR